ncbi:dTMP kinase [Stackebrandtia albiflava]|uniref:Thymidylate kinase n=1 Tax=Stackebrandtia albiflava TaxID=406432 RepID=A0A562V2S1_9ACTN|nr:dTMP kinase [Stackebrandtia albiflava]TWJ12189.1 dTMP kinase [Stackebrandtia albiflava]
MAGVADLKAILRIRPFRRLWTVLGLTATGDWLGLLAATLFAASQFDNPTAQGAAFSSVIIMRLLPSLVLGPIAGVFADRFDRRITMAVCDFLRFALYLSMPLVAVWVGGGIRAATWIVIAQFMIEAVSMMWMPAKEAAVPNLLPKSRLESANQLSLLTTYGIAPVVASGVMSILESVAVSEWLAGFGDWAQPSAIGLYINALAWLTASVTVFFFIPEISIRRGADAVNKGESQGMIRQFTEGWRYVGRNHTIRGLVFGIMGAFGGAGVVIGTGPFYAGSLGGGGATFTVLFATIFIGLGIGLVVGPIAVRDLSRRRWFGMSIVLAGIGLLLNAIAPLLWIAVLGTLIVGTGAGMAFLAGITLLGREVDDAVRGRIFAFINTGARVVLMGSVAGAGVVAGYGSARRVDLWLFSIDLSFSRLLLLVAAALSVFAGVLAFRQMDDKPGVPVLADLWGSIRGRPLLPGTAAGGMFVVFEGGEGSGKSTQAVKLAAWLRVRGHEVVLTREPGATDLGNRIRSLVLEPQSGGAPSPRAEALLYAADRAQHVDKVLRPALSRGAVVVSDRYIDSSRAYQGSGRQLPDDEVAWLSNWATDGLKPDLVVLLDIDPVTGLRRATEGGKADRLEQESVEFHEKVRDKFRDIAAADPNRYLVVDASQTPEEISERINAHVGQRLAAPTDGRNESGWPEFGGGSAGSPGSDPEPGGDTPEPGPVADAPEPTTVMPKADRDDDATTVIPKADRDDDATTVIDPEATAVIARPERPAVDPTTPLPKSGGKREHPGGPDDDPGPPPVKFKTGRATP